MDADNKSENGSDFEHVDAREEQLQDQQQNQFHQDLLDDVDIQLKGQRSRDSFNFVTEELSKMQEEEMNNLRAENVQLKAEVEMMKNEKQLLLENNHALASEVGLLRAQNGELQAKMKVIELEVKQLTDEQLAKVVEGKVNEANAKLREELQHDFGEQLQLMKGKMVDVDIKWKKEMQDKQQKSSEQQEKKIAQKEKKLESMVKQLDEGMADLESQMVRNHQEFEEHLALVKSGVAEGKKELRDVIQQNYDELQMKIFYKDKEMKAELEKQVEQLDQRMAVFGGKIFNLESQTAVAHQHKLGELAKKLANLEVKENESQKEMELWKNNRWENAGHVQLTVANKQTSWTNVRAHLPISSTTLKAVPGRSVYYEVLVRIDSRLGFTYIGWVGAGFPLQRSFVGNHPGSFAIDESGTIWESGKNMAENVDGFHNGDVVGTGLLVTKGGQFKLFFTKNGRLNGNPIALIGQTPIYPAASFSPKNQAAVEANFGADPGKPFKFDLEAYRAQLFN